MKRRVLVTQLERLTGFRPPTPVANIVTDVVADVRERLPTTARTRSTSTAS